MTRGKAQELFEISTVPAYLTRKVKTEDMVEPKAPVKVKATKKVAKRTATKKVAKRTATKVAKKSTPKVAAKAAPSDLEKRMAFVEGEVSKMSEDVNLIKSTLDQLVTQLKLA